MGKFKKMMEVSSNVGNYSNADEGEPDTGFVGAGRYRVLGTNAGKPEPWLDKLGMKQLQYPKADDPFGGDEKVNLIIRWLKNL